REAHALELHESEVTAGVVDHRAVEKQLGPGTPERFRVLPYRLLHLAPHAIRLPTRPLRDDVFRFVRTTELQRHDVPAVVALDAFNTQAADRLRWTGAISRTLWNDDAPDRGRPLDRPATKVRHLVKADPDRSDRVVPLPDHHVRE